LDDDPVSARPAAVGGRALKKTTAAALAVAAVLAAAGVELWSQRQRAGFVARENRPLAQLIDASRIGEQTALIASRPHRAGTPANGAVAGLIGDRLQRIGLRVWNTPFEAEVYEPLAARLSLEEHGAEKAYDLSEPGDGEPGFLAYSPDADLAADVIFANEGSRADYELLLKKKIAVRGKLALVRAQGICRSMKAEIAGSLGVAGLILYPEPRDQGFAKPAFPDGPNTPRWAIPRGTLLRYYLYPGDPETSRAKGIGNLPPVPALGVSQAVAEDLLSRMRGDAAPEAWKGWLKAPYVLASAGPRVRLVVKGQLVKKTLRNLFAILPGRNGDERPVMVGNHYDAWERGAVDAGSGTAVVLEAAEALTKLRSGGWRPERSILFAFWDGEEAGMFGSTRWVEQALKDRFEGLAAYINVDSAVRANDFVGDVMPGLRGPLANILSVVGDSTTGKTLAEAAGTFRFPGFSSDTAPFLGLTGTPVAEIGFGRHYPVYHTRADTVEWIRRFGDPGFTRAALLARILALYAGWLANDPIVPYRFAEVSEYARNALGDLDRKAASSGEWDPYTRGLRDALDAYDRVARRWDGEARRLASLSPKKAQAASALVERAMAAFGRLFGGRAPVYGRGSVLIGPFEGDGCEPEPLASFARAVRARNFDAIRLEGAELARAFTQAQELLRAAEWTALGPGRPVRSP
jgi:N-acetylated-alpha-linked acidic dipeptidase